MNENVTTLPLSAIHADWEWNCRGGEIPPADVFELMESIKENGLLQPVVVILHPPWRSNPTGKKYLLVLGHRRLRAHQLLGLDTIRAIVSTGIDSEEMAVSLNLVENLARQDLTVTQEVGAVSRLYKLGLSRESISLRLHKSPGWVQVRTMLIKLPSYVAEELQKGMIGQSQVRRLYTIYTATLKKSDEVEAEDVLIKALKKLKHAKITGAKRDPLSGIEDEGLRKHALSRKEMFEIQEHIYNNVGACLATKAIAYIAGEIPYKDLEEDLKLECRALDRIYMEKD